MKNLFLALALMLVGTFAFADKADNLIVDEIKCESLINLENLDDSYFLGINAVPNDTALEISEFYANCVYIVEFQTSGGDTLATFTYTYQSDNCSSQHSSLLNRAKEGFNELF